MIIDFVHAVARMVGLVHRPGAPPASGAKRDVEKLFRHIEGELDWLERASMRITSILPDADDSIPADLRSALAAWAMVDDGERLRAACELHHVDADMVLSSGDPGSVIRKEIAKPVLRRLMERGISSAQPT